MGEGCISIYKRGKNAYKLEIFIHGTDLSVIGDLPTLVGVGRFRVRPSRSKMWLPCGEYRVVGNNTRIFLEAIMSYTKIKKREVELAFELLACERGKRKPVYDKFREYRDGKKAY